MKKVSIIIPVFNTKRVGIVSKDGYLYRYSEGSILRV